MEEINEYEAQRLRNIARNQSRLQELGLNTLKVELEANHPSTAQLKESKKKKKEKATVTSSPPKPIRQSKRVRGEAADNHISLSIDLDYETATTNNNSRSVIRRPPPSSTPSNHHHPDIEVPDGEDPQLLKHNLMRLRSMSLEALKKRVAKITNLSKLMSFITALNVSDIEEEDRGHLINLAQDRIEQLRNGNY
jgi:hypothetical protein